MGVIPGQHYQGPFAPRPSRGKDSHAILKHWDALKYTPFEACAFCPGCCPGKIEVDPVTGKRKMMCSRDGDGAGVDEDLAPECQDSEEKLPHTLRKKKNSVSPNRP